MEERGGCYMQTEVIRLTTEEISVFLIQKEEERMVEAYQKMPKWKKMLYKLLIKLGGIN